MKKLLSLIMTLISICFITLTVFNKPVENNSIMLNSYNNEYVENYAKDNNYNYIELSDSEYNNLMRQTSNFEYNVVANGIEITEYKGIEKDIIIPETIDNKEVTTISLKLKEIPKSIYIPSTVNKINSVMDSNLHNNYYKTIILEVIVLIISLVSVLLLNRKKNQSKQIYLISLYFLSFIYLILMSLLVYFELKNIEILFIIITIIYLIIFISIYSVSTRLKTYDQEVDNIKSFIDEALTYAKKINNYELNEKIKYSDSVSNERTKELELEILKKIKNISTENNKNNISDIIDLIDKRNELCKKTKNK